MTMRPAECSDLTTSEEFSHISMSYIVTSNDWSTVPWSCHCQLVLSAGCQHLEQATGGKSDFWPAVGRAFAEALHEQHRTVTRRVAVNQPVPLSQALEGFRLCEARTGILSTIACSS